MMNVLIKSNTKSNDLANEKNYRMALAAVMLYIAVAPLRWGCFAVGGGTECEGLLR